MITRYGKPHFVVMSCEHFKALQTLLTRTNSVERTE
ncbi:MAG: hypothetical protein JKY31_06400 [Rhodobacteraceae bacterium]|nr:hypothetical protein [Paracoccaceae bacterium]